MTYTKKAPKSKKVDKEFKSPEEKLCERLISLIESGVNPWRKEWDTVNNGRHRNFITGKNYHGSNPMMLEFQMMFGGYSLPIWAGAGQMKGKGWWLKKGCSSAYILRPELHKYEKKDEAGEVIVNVETGETEKGSFVKYKGTPVFNIQCFRGVDEKSEKALQDEIAKQLGEKVEERDENKVIENAQEILKTWSKEVTANFVGDKAFYIPSKDEITIPPLKTFHSAEAFYATWFHEAVHSTGHDSRLKRGLTTTHGTTEYANEELIAEMGAFILCTRAEIGSNVENHAAYLEGWLKVLKQGPKALLKAVSAATKAANLIYPEVHSEEDQ
jgi:antirestriction protein ArdC